MGSEWNNLVKKVYDQNKSKPGYSLGDAMKEASKLRKSGKMPKMKGSRKAEGKKKSRRARKGSKSCKKR